MDIDLILSLDKLPKKEATKAALHQLILLVGSIETLPSVKIEEEVPIELIMSELDHAIKSKSVNQVFRLLLEFIANVGESRGH